MKSTILSLIISVATLTFLFFSGVAFSEEWVAGSGTLYVNPTTTNVGIGTTDLDGTPAIGKVTIKGTTSDGSTNILVGRDSAESNVFTLNTIGKMTGSALSISEYITNNTNEIQLSSSMYPTTSTSNTSYHYGASHYIKPLINTGITQSGAEVALYSQLLRNNYNSSADENGTLTSLLGQEIVYGHSNTNTAATPTTTNVYGLYLYPYYRTGTVTNWYDLYIGAGSSGGTITNRYAIFQASTAAKNYFGGNVGIGTVNPTGGKLQILTNGTSVGGITLYDGSGTSARFWTDGSNNLIIGRGVSSYFAMDSSGNVGIGTVNPTGGKLQILTNGTSVGGITLYDGSGTSARFWTDASNNLIIGRGTSSYFAMDSSGNVGIGTTSPNYKLDVLGTIRAQEVKVATGWSDFVFEDDYALPSLERVESYVKENKHLPDVPSAKEIQDGGLPVAEMMAKQMQKIEELTLYVIEQNKKLADLSEENKELKNRIIALEKGN